MPAPRPIAERFAEKVDRSAGPTGCWPWLGARDRRGYGVIWLNGRMHKAHRVARALVGRPIADGIEARHSCDSPPCVNPTHIQDGDHQANMTDMAARGRAAAGDRNGTRRHPDALERGSRRSNARLSEAEVAAARALYARGGISQWQLAASLGVSQSTLSLALRGRTWAHVR